MSDSKSLVAYCPGSFDPLTNGHLNIIERAARLFSFVIVGVAKEAEKEHLFSLAERVAICQEALAHLPNVRVEAFEGLLVEAARRAGASVIIKGLRQPTDWAHEAPMAAMNRALAPELETLFLPADPALAHLSSRLIRWVCALGGDITAYVPPAAARRLQARLQAQAEPPAAP